MLGQSKSVKNPGLEYWPVALDITSTGSPTGILSQPNIFLPITWSTSGKRCVSPILSSLALSLLCEVLSFPFSNLFWRYKGWKTFPYYSYDSLKLYFGSWSFSILYSPKASATLELELSSYSWNHSRSLLIIFCLFGRSCECDVVYCIYIYKQITSGRLVRQDRYLPTIYRKLYLWAKGSYSRMSLLNQLQ